MSTRYQYENLLRKPVEYYSAAAYLVASLITFAMPNILLMPKAVAFTGGWALLFRGLQRFSQGYKLHEYQRTLSKLGSFKTAPKPLMDANKAQWLGLGFIWDGRHTQRLFDLEKPENRHLLTQKTFSKKIQMLINWLDKRLPHPYRQAYELPLPEGGGRPEIHAVGLWEGERDIGIYFSNHIGHSLILGNTRTGKTRLLEIELIQAIARKERVFVFDAKGDADLLKRAYTQNHSNKEAPFYYVNFMDVSETHVIHWDPTLLDLKKTLGQGKSLELFVLRYVYLLSELLHYANRPINHLEEVYENPYALLFQILKQYLEEATQSGLHLTTAHELCIEYYKHPQVHSPLYNAVYGLLQVAPKTLKEVLLPNKSLVLALIYADYAPAFFYSPNKIQIAMDRLLAAQPGTFYLGLNNNNAPIFSKCLTQLAIEELTHGLSIKPSAETPTILADELGSILHNQYLESLNELGKHGIKASLYEQFLPKSPNQANNSTEFILSHFSQLIFFRHAEQTVCDFLMRRQKDVHVTTTDLISGTVDNSNIKSEVTFTSSTTQRQTRQRTALLSINDFVALPIGQAFGLLNGNELIKVRIPLVDFVDEEALPEYLCRAIERMHKHYQSANYGNGGASTRSSRLQPAQANIEGFPTSSLLHHPEASYMGVQENELAPPTTTEDELL